MRKGDYTGLTSWTHSEVAGSGFRGVAFVDEVAASVTEKTLHVPFITLEPEHLWIAEVGWTYTCSGPL
jgi:hypothetical protein